MMKPIARASFIVCYVGAAGQLSNLFIKDLLVLQRMLVQLGIKQHKQAQNYLTMSDKEH